MFFFCILSDAVTVQVADTLVQLPRTSGDDEASQDVAALVENPDNGSILEELEKTAAEEGIAGPSTGPRRKRKKPADNEEETVWMKDLRITMHAHQSLLEKLVDDKTKRHETREPFIDYVTATLRNCSEEQYTSLQDVFLDAIRPRAPSLQHSRGTSLRPSPAIAPPAGQPMHPPQLYYHQLQPAYYQPPAIQEQSSNWHFTPYQPQESQQIRVPRSRPSADVVGNILVGEDWESFNSPSRTPSATGSSRVTELSEETE